MNKKTRYVKFPKKTEHFLPPDKHTYKHKCTYQGVRIDRFSENLACFVFLSPFEIRPFALLLTKSNMEWKLWRQNNNVFSGRGFTSWKGKKVWVIFERQVGMITEQKKLKLVNWNLLQIYCTRSFVTILYSFRNSHPEVFCKNGIRPLKTMKVIKEELQLN